MLIWIVCRLEQYVWNNSEKLTCRSCKYSSYWFEFTFLSAQLLLKEPRRKEKKVKKEWKNTSDGEDEEKMNCDSPGRSDAEHNSNSDDNDDEDVVRRPKKARKPVAPETSESDSDLEDLDMEDAEKVMRLLPDNTTSLLDFANAVQGILLLLVLKQHLKNQYGFSDR